MNTLSRTDALVKRRSVGAEDRNKKGELIGGLDCERQGKR
jgi:hypothetical protein